MSVTVPKRYVGERIGINTEAPLTSWPDGYLMDCVNLEILPDGSFKRRYGLREEDNPYLLAQDIYNPEMVSVSFVWENVANTDIVFTVCQVGHKLYVADNIVPGNIISAGERLYFELDLYSVVSPSYLNDDAASVKLKIAKEPCSFSYGMGKLYVTHKYCEPLMIEYDSANSEFAVEELVIKERDYIGIKDEVPIDLSPSASQLASMGASESHLYNLFNRGWSQANIDAFLADKSVYPAKNMLMSYGYRRYDDISTNTKSYSPEEGIKEFSSDKLVNELFGQASAPQGHLITKVWDTTQVWSGVGTGAYTTAPVTAVSVVNSSLGVFDITCTATGHGLTLTDNTYISNMILKFEVFTLRFSSTVKKTISGTYEVIGVPNANQFTFRYKVADSKVKYKNVISLGTYTSADPLITNTTYGEVLPTRFRVNTFFQGRLWLAGLDEGRALNRIYFSKITEHREDTAICHTEADPTDLRISEPVATDGGYLTINDLGRVRALVPYGNSILVFSTEGVWQIGPGELGFFSPISYSIRRITTHGIIGQQAVVMAGNTPIYWGKDAIYAITEDTNSGYLSATDISSNTVNRLFTQISQVGKERVIAQYDDLDKRVFFLYGGLDETSSELEGSIFFQKIGPTAVDTYNSSNAWLYRNHLLVLDLRTGGFTRWKTSSLDSINRYVYNIGLFIPPNKYISDRRFKINVLTFSPASPTISSNSVYWYQFSDSVSYRDRGTSSDAYVLTGPETLGYAGLSKAAPYVMCYFRRVAGSSCLLQPVWDWSKSTATGNVGNPQQVYREVSPAPEGSKLIVTKNKILGRGHALYLGFHSMPDKPMWLEGWEVQHTVEKNL